MKILIATSTLPYSEKDKVPKFVDEQADQFMKHSLIDEVIVVAPHFKSEFYSNQEKHNYEVVRFNYFIPKRFQSLVGNGILPALKENPFRWLQVPAYFFALFWVLLRETRKNNPDILYAHWFTPQGIIVWLVSKITKTPYLITTHSSDMQVLKKVPFGIKLAKKICKDSMFINVVSEQTINKTKRLFSNDEWKEIKSKFIKIPMGVNFENYNKTKNSNENENQKEKFTLLFIGRLVEVKGIEIIIKAIDELRDLKDVELIIAGEGQEKQKYIDLVKTMNLEEKIDFVGFISGEAKIKLFDQADVVCLTSIVDSNGHTEGLPVVFMEALSTKNIIIASDVSGAQLFINDSVNGYIYPYGDHKALAKKIVTVKQLSNNGVKNMKSQAYKLSEKFEWKYLVDKLIKEIQRAL